MVAIQNEYEYILSSINVSYQLICFVCEAKHALYKYIAQNYSTVKSAPIQEEMC